MHTHMRSLVRPSILILSRLIYYQFAFRLQGILVFH